MFAALSGRHPHQPPSRRTPRRASARLAALAGLLSLAAVIVPRPAAGAGDGVGDDVHPSPSQGVARPASDVPAVDLAAQLEPLPLVVLDAGDAGDQAAIASYREATFKNIDAVGELYGASFDAIDVPDGDAAAVLELQRLIVEEPEEVAGSDASTAVRLAVAALDADPGNPDRLGNALVAAWLFGVLAAVDDDSSYNWDLQRAAVAVLFELDRRYPGRRAILLNLAFLTTVMPGLEFSGAEFAEQALVLDSTDVTARALLASIQSRRADAVDGVEQALATLAPFLADPATAALGEALTGDAHLAAASVRRAEAPASSRFHARLAVEAYDRALLLARDPALEAGRARAFERLGDLQQASAAQGEAVAQAPSALDFHVELARLRERAGDDAGLREAAEAAVTKVMAGWDPPLTGARFVTAPLDDPLPDDRGFLGWSIGSQRDHLPVSPDPNTGAGAGVVIVETVQREPPGIDLELFSTVAPRAAWRLAFDAAILAGDGAAASSLEATWNRVSTWDGDWEGHVAAANLAARGGAATADGSGTSELIARTALQRTSRFGQAAQLCRDLGDRGCAGENTFLAGDPAAALVDLEAALAAELEDPTQGPETELRMQVAAAAEGAGDVARAEALLAETAGADDAGAWRAIAALRSGDLHLGAGDPNGAVAWYDLSLATIEANGLAEARDYHRNLRTALGYRGLRQVAQNNRAVALLRTLPAGPDGAPLCDPGFARERCEAALAAVQAAAASDPDNAVYRMNEGWASRLLGKTVEARAALERAVELDPSLFPAFNDLGILLALDGDAAGARVAFTAAMAAEPAYALARWNLGIVALRDGPGGTVEGQRLLAEAIRLQPALRTSSLDFRPDEEIYPFGFEAALPVASDAPPGRTFSVGAVVLAGAASVAALGQLASTLFGHGVQTAIGSAQGYLERLGRHRRWRLRQRAFRRRLPAGARGWLAWLSVALLLGVVTAWQAAQSAPTIAGSAIATAIAATLLALIAHETGHLLAARALGGRLVPAAWGPGAIVSLIFLPVQAATGPFFAERFRPRSGNRKGAWRFHVAGPAANALVAVVAYLLFLAEPAPALRLIAQIQLAAIGYTLLPARPLDGWALKREQPRLLLAIGFAVLAAATAFALGLL